jgi:two-component system NtrC family sensor kinase
MNQRVPMTSIDTVASATAAVRGRGLFVKYVLLFLAVVSVALITYSAFEIGFFYQERHDALFRIQREQAAAAAGKIGDFVDEIKDQLDWTTHSPWTVGMPDHRLELWRLVLHQVPSISDLTLIDANGREQLRVSRTVLDEVGSQTDWTDEAEFREAIAHSIYYGPVYFRLGSEPYMTIAMAGPRPGMGVRVAEVNLKFIWDVISKITVGDHGQAYVVDKDGRLVAHTDLSLVLRNMDLSRLEQVRAALTQAGRSSEQVKIAEDLDGHPVLAAYAPIMPLGWTVFTELPLSEAKAPLYAAVARSGMFLLLGLGLALVAGLFLARRMIVPIQTLREGAAQISQGNLDHRVLVKTGDEFEELAEQFNHMAERLQDSYSNLEGKIEARTRELGVATQRLASQTALTANQASLARITRLITMGEMAASIAHEINQPLAGIVANASAGLRWLSNATPNLDEAKSTFRQIIAAGHHAADVIGSIRAMFRKGDQQKTRVDINALVTEVIELVHGELDKHKVSAKLELSDHLPRVAADRVQVQQVILNLVMNAIDAMDSIGDRPRILHIKTELRSPDQLLVSIADTGAGIDPENAARIFDSFFTTKPQGTGMGLAICRSIVETHKGRLWVSANSPNGSEFHLSLPVDAAG